MKTINSFLLEKLVINSSSKLVKRYYEIPVFDYDTGEVDKNTIWRKLELPEKQYVIYNDKYRGNAPHLSDFMDFLASIMFFEDDYEDFNPEKDILYSSDDLKDILEWYFKNIYKIDIPKNDDDVDEWAANIKTKKFHDQPNVLFDMYIGQDDYYDNINVNFSDKKKIINNAIDMVSY